MNIYKLTAPRYNTLVNQRFYQTIADRLLDQINPDREVRTILEIGAGTGFSTAVLRKRFPAAQVTALEPCAAMMTYGRQRVPDVTWSGTSVLEFPRRPFDLVVASMSYHWLNEAERTKLAEAAADGVLAAAVSVTDRFEPVGTVSVGDPLEPMGTPRDPAENPDDRSTLENATESHGCKADERRGEGCVHAVRDRAEAEDNAADGVFGRASRGSNKVSPSGNELLKKVVFSTRPRSSQPRQLRRAGCLSRDLRQHFSRIRATHLKMSETFTAADFAEVLYARGALSALFDDRADRARRALRDASTGLQDISFSWNIALLTADS